MTHSIVFLFLLSPFQCIDVHYTHGTRPQNSSNSSNFTTPPYLPTIYPEQHSRISTAGRVYCTLYSFFFKSCSIPGFPPPFLFLYSVGAVWVRRRWQSQRSVRALDTCNYAQVKWTLAFSLLLLQSLSSLFFFSSFYGQVLSGVYFLLRVGETRERESQRKRESSGFLVCNSLVARASIKKEESQGLFFFLGCRLLRSESRMKGESAKCSSQKKKQRFREYSYK